MIKPTQLYRMLTIFRVLLRYTINRNVLGPRAKVARLASYLNPYSFRVTHNRGQALRLSFEKLGPIFVKFGQLLSIRGDMFPSDIIKELEKLQDDVAPFASEQAITILEKNYQRKIDQVFSDFDPKPLASASVAQVHTATLPTGQKIVIKILRPGIQKTIDQDLALMKFAARWIERWFSFGKQLRPTELVEEFEHTITGELDLQREAASAATLRRNFQHSAMMYVPEVFWDYTSHKVMVMERIYGVRISDIDTLKQHKVNLKRLAEYGVEIFFTQVFRDSFFHADMHPGNLFVDITDPENPRYIGVDFGIMGSLSEDDQRYIGENLLAFFNRDYRRVAELHIESGWVPSHTRVDQLEAAVRSVSEPIFQKSLNEISFAKLFLQLIRVAGSFKMEAQPQLLLLQKTLLGIESLGRRLYPELDLWVTAKPFLETWLKQQKSPRKLLKKLCQQWHPNTQRLLELPQKLDRFLTESPRHTPAPFSPPKTRRWLFGLGVLLLLIATVLAWLGQTSHLPVILSAALVVMIMNWVK